MGDVYMIVCSGNLRHQKGKRHIVEARHASGDVREGEVNRGVVLAGLSSSHLARGMRTPPPHPVHEDSMNFPSLPHSAVVSCWKTFLLVEQTTLIIAGS